MFDAVKNYLALASGFTEVTRQRALAAAKALVASGEATAEQVTNLADDLLTTSRNNRDTILALVRYEIDRALIRLGLATSEEVSALSARLNTLETTGSAAGPAGPPPGAPARPTKRATKSARKAPGKRSPAKRAPAKRVAGSGSSPAATGTPGPAKKAPAKKSVAKKAPAKKAAPPAGPSTAPPVDGGGDGS
jgi:polyhydroxyalkanoate synthesis regulator phasin